MNCGSRRVRRCAHARLRGEWSVSDAFWLAAQNNPLASLVVFVVVLVFAVFTATWIVDMMLDRVDRDGGDEGRW